MKRYIGIGLLVVVLLTFFYVSPGVWRYRYTSESHQGLAALGDDGRYTVQLRIDKLTGHVQEYNKETRHWE